MIFWLGFHGQVWRQADVECRRLSYWLDLDPVLKLRGTLCGFYIESCNYQD
jgi:hypothetical protein